MNVLFICGANVGRSQIATAFFNRLSKSHKAVDAGIHVNEHEGESLHKFVIQCMFELDYDLSKNTRKQLIPWMVKEADKIVIMADKMALPDFIDMSKVVFWEIDDPKNKSLEYHRLIRDQIKSSVEKLVKEIE